MKLAYLILTSLLGAEAKADENTACVKAGIDCTRTQDAQVTASLLQRVSDLKESSTKLSKAVEGAPAAMPAKLHSSFRESLGRWMTHQLHHHEASRQYEEALVAVSAKPHRSFRESLGRWVTHQLHSDEASRQQPDAMIQKASTYSRHGGSQLGKSIGHVNSEPKVKGHVNYLFTWGAPGSLTSAHVDKTKSNECFSGLRFYREEKGYQDLPAEFTGFLHPKMDLIILGANQKLSSYHACLPEENFGQVNWPNKYSEFPSVDIHSGTELIGHARRVYEHLVSGDDLKGLESNRRSDVTDAFRLGLSAGGLVDDLTVWIPTGNMAQEGFNMIKEGIPKGGHTSQVKGVGLGSDWRLVGANMLKDPNFLNDYDWVVLAQNVDTLDCILTLDSADLQWPFSEQRLALHLQKEDFCGCEKCAHAGFLQELRATVENKEYQESIPPKLQHCNNVAVTGYSIGGATADLFTYCANSGLNDDPDYKLISWSKGTPKLMEELTEEGFGIK